MIKYFKKAFKITNENIILTTPLILFVFIFNIYLWVAQSTKENLLSAILVLCTILFMLSAFFAGWLFMVRKAIELDKKDFIMDEDRAKASFNLIKEFPIGIGEYFAPFIGASIIYVGLFVLILFIVHLIGMHFIGKVDLTPAQIKMTMGSHIVVQSLVASFSLEQLKKINAWLMLIVSVIPAFYFITMFWFSQIVFKTKNPLIAFFKSITFTFKNFLSAIILFMYVSFINLTVYYVILIASNNYISHFIATLIHFYFLVYVVVLIFLYYDREHDRTNSQQITETQSPCDSGTDSIGQDETGDTEGDSE